MTGISFVFCIAKDAALACISSFGTFPKTSSFSYLSLLCCGGCINKESDKIDSIFFIPASPLKVALTPIILKADLS